MPTKVEEHADYLIQDPDDADGVIFIAKVRIKKADIEAGIIELAAIGSGWNPASNIVVGAACNAAVVRFANAAVETGYALQLEAEKQSQLQQFRATREAANAS